MNEFFEVLRVLIYLAIGIIIGDIIYQTWIVPHIH